MLESRFRFKYLAGYSLILLGFLGIGYLVWVYFLWGTTLPKFKLQASEYQDLFTTPAGGFGILLGVDSEGNPVETIQVKTSPEQITIDRSSISSADNVLSQRSEDKVYMTIPRLSIDKALVELDVDGNHEYIYDTVLTRAIAHLKNSAYPGQQGNSFLFGHSKLPVLAGSDYESIFTNLPKVKLGDVIRVYYQKTEYTYQVGQVGVVDPSDVFILNQPPTKRMLTVMTCIPPGFDHQRYIVLAELIEAKPWD